MGYMGYNIGQLHILLKGKYKFILRVAEGIKGVGFKGLGLRVQVHEGLRALGCRVWIFGGLGMFRSCFCGVHGC